MRFLHRRFTLGLLLFLAGLVTGTAQAQTTTAVLTGEVRTLDDEPVDGAIVQARSVASGEVRTAISDAKGVYRLESLAPGEWTVAARTVDGGISESRGVELRLQETVRLNFKVGTGTSEKVTVTAETPLVDPKQTAGQLHFDREQIATLPLSGRSFTDLALLDSSVGAAPTGNYYGEKGSAFVVNGQGGRSNNFLVDGMDNNDQTSGTSLNSFYSQQVIQEFVLQTHQFSPEFGRASGGVLNIVTRRGQNEKNFGAFIQGTNDRWNSSGSFVDSLPTDSDDQTAVRRLDVGFNFGGAFKKDKAFYFVAFEHQEHDDVLAFTGVERDGVALDPDDVVAGGVYRAPTNTDHLFFRADFNVSPKHTMMLRITANQQETNGINVLGINTPESGFKLDETDYGAALTATSVLKANLVNEARVLIATSTFDQLANSSLSGVSRPSGIFGGNNLNMQQRDEDRFQLVDNITWSTGNHTAKFGIDILHSRTNIATRFNPNGNFLYNSDLPLEPGDCGNLGFLQVLNAPDPTAIDCPGAVGIDDDGDGVIDETGNIDTYPVVFSYILGIGAELDEDGNVVVLDPARINDAEIFMEDTKFSLFAQDKWQVSQKLLIDYGLRYDVNTYVLPASAQVESTIPNGGATVDTDNIAPRFGFTWTPKRNGQLVIRGGGGIFYDKLVLGFPAVSAITSGTQIGLFFPQPLTVEANEDFVEEEGIEALVSNLFFIDELVMRFSTAPELETPYTVQYNLGIEVPTSRNSAFRANAMVMNGYHTPLMVDLNPPEGTTQFPFGVCPDDIAPFEDEVIGFPCHVNDPSTGSIAALTTDGRTWYEALDLGWRYRGKSGWFSTSYTWSRAEDMGFDPLKNGISLPADSSNLQAERGRSDGDRRHNFVLSGDTRLPWMGLRLSGALRASSGLAFNVTTGTDDNLDGLLNDRPDGIGRNTGADTNLAVVNALRAETNESLPADRQLDPVTHPADEDRIPGVVLAGDPEPGHRRDQRRPVGGPPTGRTGTAAASSRRTWSCCSARWRCRGSRRRTTA